jgi:hypothetical protein
MLKSRRGTWISVFPALKNISAALYRRFQLRAVQRSYGRIKCVRNLLQRSSDGGIQVVEKRRTELNQELESKTHSIVALQKILRVEDSTGEVFDVDADK